MLNSMYYYIIFEKKFLEKKKLLVTRVKRNRKL